MAVAGPRATGDERPTLDYGKPLLRLDRPLALPNACMNRHYVAPRHEARFATRPPAHLLMPR